MIILKFMKILKKHGIFKFFEGVGRFKSSSTWYEDASGWGQGARTWRQNACKMLKNVSKTPGTHVQMHPRLLKMQTYRQLQKYKKN